MADKGCCDHRHRGVTKTVLTVDNRRGCRRWINGHADRCSRAFASRGWIHLADPPVKGSAGGSAWRRRGRSEGSARGRGIPTKRVAGCRSGHQCNCRISLAVHSWYHYRSRWKCMNRYSDQGAGSFATVAVKGLTHIKCLYPCRRGTRCWRIGQHDQCGIVPFQGRASTHRCG